MAASSGLPIRCFVNDLPQESNVEGRTTGGRAPRRAICAEMSVFLLNTSQTMVSGLWGDLRPVTAAGFPHFCTKRS
jgi:hypothetical protein